VTTGRHPRFHAAELDAVIVDDDRRTYDELRPVTFAAGSDPSAEPTRVKLDADYYDRDGDDLRNPRYKDLVDTVAAQGQELAAIRAELPKLRRQSRIRRYGIPSLSAIAGAVSAVLVYTYGFAADQGDARATAREREAERVQLLRDVRELREGRATDRARLDSIDERFRLFFPAGALRLQGPTFPPPPGDP
jgi:hypothetical protein